MADPRSGQRFGKKGNVFIFGREGTRWPSTLMSLAPCARADSQTTTPSASSPHALRHPQSVEYTQRGFAHARRIWFITSREQLARPEPLARRRGENRAGHRCVPDRLSDPAFRDFQARIGQPPTCAVPEWQGLSLYRPQAEWSQWRCGRRSNGCPAGRHPESPAREPFGPDAPN